MADHPQRITRLTPLADALARMDAVGRVLAADAIAPSDLPPQAIALRDGWAVRANDLADASSYAPVSLPGIPHRIDTGEALPREADTVASVDVVAERAGHAEATASVIPGEGVLPVSADMHAGDGLLSAGTMLTVSRAAVLAVAGIVQVSVRAPRIRVDGDRDGLLARLVTFSGGTLTDGEADAIIRIGGTGSGRKDAAVYGLAREGRVDFHGVGIAPGDSVAFGVMGTTPVLLLPGRLDARLAAWLLIGCPLFARLAGGSAPADGRPAKLKRKAASSIGLAEIMPVRLANGEAEPLASGHWPLSAIAQSDGWIVVPAESEGYPAGAEVVVRPWP